VTLAPGKDENSRVATLSASPGWTDRIAGLMRG
jgi:hypothetical protein